jgi:hypothetical protein
VTVDPQATPLKSVNTPHTGKVSSPSVIDPIWVKVSGCFNFIESGIVASNILVSKTKSLFSVISISLQLMKYWSMKLPVCLSQ